MTNALNPLKYREIKKEREESLSQIYYW